MPDPQSVLPKSEKEVNVRNIVVLGSKVVEEGKDFGAGVAKKIIVKGLLQALHEDLKHKHSALVSQLSN